MIRKIREITFQGTNYLSCKAHNFEKQLLITINDTINNNNIIIIIAIKGFIPTLAGANARLP